MAAPRRWRRAAIAALWAGAALASAPDASAQTGSDTSRAEGPGTVAREAGPVPLSELLGRAREAIASRQAARVLPELKAQQTWYAGSPPFDYLLGMAALDAGEPGLAILAFERVLAQDPGHLPARAEIGRAYLAARETDEARRQFEAVARQPIPDDVRRVIDAYLTGIARAQADARPQFHGHLELAVGWDSNVNLGSHSNEWLLAGGLAVIPEAVSRPRSSAQSTVNAGFSWVVPISGRWQWIGGAQVWHRANPSAHTLDTSSLELNTGFGWRTDCHAVNMLVQHQHLRLDRQGFRDATGLMAQWRCDLSERAQIGAYVQGTDFRFPEQPVRDAQRSQVGVTGAAVPGGARGPVWIGNAYVGEERPRQSLDQLRYRFHGARGAVNLAGPGSTRWSASLAWEERRYAGAEPLFDQVRRDRQLEAALTVEIPLDRQWSVLPQLSSLRNRSNLAPNDFRRHQAQLAVRARF